MGYTKYGRYECGHCGRKLSTEKKVFAVPQAALNIVYNIPGRPKPVPVVEEPIILPPPPEEPFHPVLRPVPDFTGRAGQLQKDNPVLAHISLYKPYDRTRILRRDKAALFVRFPLAKSELHTDFRDNREVLDRIIDITRQIMADTASSVKILQIIGLASIEGPIAGNEKLATNRPPIVPLPCSTISSNSCRFPTRCSRPSAVARHGQSSATNWKRWWPISRHRLKSCSRQWTSLTKRTI